MLCMRYDCFKCFYQMIIVFEPQNEVHTIMGQVVRGGHGASNPEHNLKLLDMPETETTRPD